ncbi:MAG: hypothetical protein HYR49_09485 [Gammaproteobacteria bacterium]|nr:hypothetical protein [Gammaproteobacteria bacterium]
MTAPETGFQGLLIVVLAALGPGASAADDLGRLFTTSGERAQLDQVREEVVPRPAATPAAPAKQDAPPVSGNPLTLRGVVDRAAGRSTAWVNDSNTYQGDAGAAHRQVETSGISGNRAAVRLPDREAPVPMKVGQTYDPASARIRDLGEETGPVAAAAPAGSEEDEDE